MIDKKQLEKDATEVEKLIGEFINNLPKRLRRQGTLMGALLTHITGIWVAGKAAQFGDKEFHDMCQAFLDTAKEREDYFQNK